MGKCSVESVVDCPASTHGRSRFAGVICAATCFILTCSIIIYTMQWERGSEIESRQQMENLYELKNIVDRLNSQLKNYNTSIENVVVSFGDVSERLEELTQNVHSSHDSMIDVNDVTKEFKMSLDELKEIFVKYRNDFMEMKRKQVEIKEDLVGLRSNNNGSSNHHEADEVNKYVHTEIVETQNHTSFIHSSSITEQTLHDLIILDDANHNLRYLTVSSLQSKNILLKQILEDFEKKNYSSKMENCQVNKTELRDTISMYNKNVNILKTGLTYPSNVLSPTVEKILVSNAKKEEYRMRIDQTKNFFVVIHSRLNEILYNIVEFYKKFSRMADCIEKYRNITLSLGLNEQIQKQVGEQLDFGKIMSEINTIADNILDTENNIIKYHIYVFGIELQMDNVGNFRSLNKNKKQKKDEVPVQRITGVPDGSPVVISDVSITEVEGNGFQGQEPVNRKSHGAEESSTTPVSSSGWQNNERLEDAQDKGNSLTDEESRVDNQNSESAVEDKETTKEDKENNHMDEKNLQEHGSITNKFFEQTFFQQVTWTEAKERCEAKDMRLAVIANAKERESILTVITRSGTPAMKQDSFWISEMDQTVKDSLPPLTAHDEDSENNNDAELCPYMDVTSAGESPCSDKRSYICEKINIIEQATIY